MNPIYLILEGAAIMLLVITSAIFYYLLGA
jgi:hypothetical protein